MYMMTENQVDPLNVENNRAIKWKKKKKIIAMKRILSV